VLAFNFSITTISYQLDSLSHGPFLYSITWLVQKPNRQSSDSRMYQTLGPI
jgi:hypothetical protein